MMNRPTIPLKTCDSSFVLSQWEKGVETIQINRPQYSNSLNLATLFQLQRAVKEAIARPETLGIVITATKPGFVVGASIDFFMRNIRNGRMDRVHYYTNSGNACFDCIADSPKPIVAVVNGSALGGGFELLLACHYRFALPSAVFALPETGIGLCPSWGGLVRLPKRIGKELTKWIAYSGRFVSCSEALALGIVDAVFPSESIFTEACKQALNPAHDFPREELPNQSAIVEYFASRTAEDVYADTPEKIVDRIVASSVRQIKRNSILALKAVDEIMSGDMEVPVRRDETYQRVNDKLNRSEDTWIGLTWKREKRIGFPAFPSKETNWNE